MSGTQTPFNISDWYWVRLDTNPTTKVWSTATNSEVANNAAAYQSWLTAALTGTAREVTAKANNGGGLVRLTLNATNLSTGQYWYVQGVSADANGQWIITLIDATHIDLQGSTFNAGSAFTAGGALQGATIIDTDANLRILLNLTAIASTIPALGGFTQGGPVNLTNPLPPYTEVNINTGVNFKINLPVMNAPNSIPIGVPFRIKNTQPGEDHYQQILYNDGTTFIDLLNSGDTATLQLTANATTNGVVQVLKETEGTSLGQMGWLLGNKITATALSLTCDNGVVLRDRAGIPMRLPTTSISSTNVDIANAGPVANGRDQAAAFAAGNTIHIYLIYQPGSANILHAIASLNGPNTVGAGPTLPSGYTHWVYATSIVLVAGPNVPDIYIRGNTVFYKAQGLVLNAGTATTSTSVSTATFVPTNALSILLSGRAVFSSTAGGVGELSLEIETGGVQYAQFRGAPSAGATDTPTATIEIPFKSNAFFYRHIDIVGTMDLIRSSNLAVCAYTVPNNA